ncbi:hypothetical protein MASR1M48_08710 [Lactococcus petauri]|uniref:hypothetical protein n=1 Tax=Lactococcus TaxID=1357 RepID=UPI002096CCDA|nr:MULTISPECIES: hypothetical protein [Lactococcus]MCO7129795.1 hypothetical protein [Lactococcus garvieae]WKY24147.1 hypothetical protein P3G65_10590 [Lactococcus sp. bn62]
MEFWTTFWTAVGSIVGAFVLVVTVYQLIQQNKRQNELDERQKKIEEREKYQIDLNIKQSLFERRVTSWKIIKALYLSIDDENFILNKEDSEFPIFMYIKLTNNYYLQDIGNSIRGKNEKDHTWRRKQDSFLMKMNDMTLLSYEIPLLFSGKEGEHISNFINSYKEMIKSVRRYEWNMDNLRELSELEKEVFNKHTDVSKIKSQREDLYEQYKLLFEMYKEIKENKYIDELYQQIKFTK